jgi:quercetin dioxygenase-like cupin family protein
MKHYFGCNLQLLAIVGLLTIGCNNGAPSNNTEIADTTSKGKTETGNIPPFDPSRSVTTIAPDLYKLLSDTLNIRVLVGTYQPGDSSIIHAHPDFALYVLEGGTVELVSMDGNKQNIEFKKGMAMVLPAATHSAKNIGNTTLRLMVVEVNRPRY